MDRFKGHDSKRVDNFCSKRQCHNNLYSTRPLTDQSDVNSNLDGFSNRTDVVVRLAGVYV